MYEFHWPTRTVFGEGVLRRAAEYIQPSEKGASLVIVAPREAWVEPVLVDLKIRFEQSGWNHVALFGEVEPNPSWSTVARGQELVRHENAQSILAVGGGSTLDAAKAIAERGGADFLCTAPTTAGTGGEISPWAVISDLEERKKDSVVAKWPDLALLDPTLTLTVPPRTTLYTGIDAFVHGLEAYLSTAANPITDSLALAGMRMAVDNLDLVMANPQDLDARAAMLEASLLTGAAMLHAGLGLMHAVGNVVGGLYHQLPHGLILAGCMPVVLDYNRIDIADRLAQVESRVEKLQSQIDVWFERLQIGGVSVDEADLSLLAERAASNVNAATNPRPANEDDIRALVRAAFDVGERAAPSEEGQRDRGENP
jgi:alcohol dehydrogenase class IV